MKLQKILLALVGVCVTPFLLSASVSADEGTWKTVPVPILDPHQKPVWCYVSADGELAKGWMLIEGQWYYFQDNGVMYRNQWSGDYYLGEDGSMVKNQWILDKNIVTRSILAYYVDEDGKWVKDAVYHGLTGQWKEDEKGWWFEKEDGTYCKSELEFIDDEWYRFDSYGYIEEEQLELIDDMTEEEREFWENFDWGESIQISDVNERLSGIPHFAEEKYLASASGQWVQESDGRWWYRYYAGGYPHDGWEYILTKWYYFDSEGWRVTGWIEDGGKRYYCGISGFMVTQWYNIDGYWYYFNESGEMQTDWY